MAEIERRFLVDEPPASLAEGEGARIEQGYLAIADEVEVRLRRADGATLMTVKGGHGDVREEVEFALDPAAFAALWPLTEGRRLRKTRRTVPLEGGLSAEVDFFEGDLEGLVLAEVEFGSEADERQFEPPSWFGEELTGEQRYAGQRLATEGAPERAADRGSTFRLKRKESVASGSRRIALGRAQKALGRLADGGDADRDAAVHGVRKDLKKLRARPAAGPRRPRPELLRGAEPALSRRRPPALRPPRRRGEDRHPRRPGRALRLRAARATRVAVARDARGRAPPGRRGRR